MDDDEDKPVSEIVWSEWRRVKAWPPFDIRTGHAATKEGNVTVMKIYYETRHIEQT